MSARDELNQLMARCGPDVVLSLEGFEIGARRGDEPSLLYTAITANKEGVVDAQNSIYLCSNDFLGQLISAWLKTEQGRCGLLETPQGQSHVFSFLLAPKHEDRFRGMQIALHIGAELLHEHVAVIEDLMRHSKSRFGDVVSNFAEVLVRHGYTLNGYADHIEKMSDAQDIGLRYYAVRNLASENTLHAISMLKEQGMDFNRLQDRYDNNEFHSLIGRGGIDDDCELSYMGMALAQKNMAIVKAMLACGADQHAVHFKLRERSYTLPRLVNLIREKQSEKGDNTPYLDELSSIMSSIDTAKAARSIAAEFGDFKSVSMSPKG